MLNRVQQIVQIESLRICVILIGRTRETCAAEGVNTNFSQRMTRSARMFRRRCLCRHVAFILFATVGGIIPVYLSVIIYNVKAIVRKEADMR